ncbi:MAG: STAS domain-containing protein [Thermoguttaceae bacterium]|nr:STAS domain-containing protein [Thermoguttaceae bacterium]MDW8037346.1 STAS domain-containing protein [Thermoguttaceae bacterium]
MLRLAPGWELQVERGPDWLFVRIRNLEPDSSEIPDLADQIWTLMHQHLIYRVVLELDGIGLLRSELIGELLRLQRRIGQQGGLMRLCGLSAENRRILETCGLSDRLPIYECRRDAVLGRPTKPR